MSIDYEISRPSAKGFRRAYIKRRSNTTGLYESSWFEVTDFVKKWGVIERTVDDERLNRFVHSGLSLTMRNDTGAFNPEDNVNSLWYGYMTRYRTLIKIEAGYIDDNDAELPADPTMGIFIVADELPISAMTNDCVVRARSLISVFDEVRLNDIGGIYTTLTASQLITKIRDHTDGSGNFYFQQFISTGAWSIQATTNNYVLTSTAIGSLTCWDFMEKLAESEGYLLLINRSGGIEFRDRNERTTTSAFDFYGLGYPDMNIIGLQEYKEAYNKLYTFFRLKYLEADTSTSYVTAGSTSTVDPSSTAWKYGSRKYEFENTFIANTATAQSIVNAQNVLFSALKDEVTLKTRFIPHLEISDKVTLSYRSYDLANTTLWGQFFYGTDVFASEAGENFDWASVAYKILSISNDMTALETTFHLREI